MAAKKSAKRAKGKAGATRRPVKKTAAKRTASRPKKKAAKPMDQEAMMAAWQKASTPAENHRRLEPMAGSWVTRTTFTMAPGDPPAVSEGTSEHRLVLGGRFLEQIYKGTSMGMPFEGIGFTGYDNVQRKYVGTWMDSFGTGIMDSVGVGKPKDDELNFEAGCVDPSGSRMSFSCKVRIQDRNHHTYEMWTKAPNGKRYRAMLVEYTRR